MFAGIVQAGSRLLLLHGCTGALRPPHTNNKLYDAKPSVMPWFGGPRQPSWILTRGNCPLANLQQAQWSPTIGAACAHDMPWPAPPIPRRVSGYRRSVPSPSVQPVRCCSAHRYRPFLCRPFQKLRFPLSCGGKCSFDSRCQEVPISVVELVSLSSSAVRAFAAHSLPSARVILFWSNHVTHVSNERTLVLYEK